MNHRLLDARALRLSLRVAFTDDSVPATGLNQSPVPTSMPNRLCPLLLLFLLTFTTTTPAALLFDRAAPWLWRPGNTEASTPVTAWRTNGFNDAQFTVAPAPFWFGDVLPGGTQISGMQNVYGSFFLRKTFVVANPAEIAALRLGALVDDGFVAWINGTEVQRVNMTGAAGSASVNVARGHDAKEVA